MIYCRDCGKELDEELHVRLSVWKNKDEIKFIRAFCNYECMDEYKIPQDLNV